MTGLVTPDGKRNENPAKQPGNNNHGPIDRNPAETHCDDKSEQCANQTSRENPNHHPLNETLDLRPVISGCIIDIVTHRILTAGLQRRYQTIELIVQKRVVSARFLRHDSLPRLRQQLP